MTDIIPDGYEQTMKVNDNGEQLYILHVADEEVINNVPRTVKSTEVSDSPVMVSKQVALLDSNGQQKQYEITTAMYEQIPILDAEENVIGYENGDIIGMKGTGQFLKLWASQMVQEEDVDGDPLYWNTVYDEVISYEPQPDELIPMSDPRWTEELEEAYDLVKIPVEPYVLPKTPEQIIQENSNKIKLLTEKVVLKNADEEYQALNIETVSLDELKEKKVAQLSYLCNQEILNGFSSDSLGTTHSYGFSYEDQQNLSAMLTLMNADDTITETQWKTKDDGILLHSRAEFLAMCKDAQSHKQGHIAKYWTLKAQTESSTTKEQVTSITW